MKLICINKYISTQYKTITGEENLLLFNTNQQYLDMYVVYF
jgi:hypothetical protein